MKHFSKFRVASLILNQIIVICNGYLQMILGSAFKLSPLILLTGSRLAGSERSGRGNGRSEAGIWDSVCAFRCRAFFQHMIMI